jgi:type IV pilus assembly protein PilM
MDLKKEIKLSDLVPKPRKKSGSKTSGAVAVAPRAKKAKKSELVGLKIGASQIAAARVVNNSGKPKLVQLARTTLDPGVVVNGEVRDVNGLAKALDDFFTENKLPRKGVRLGIGTNRVGVRVVDVDGIDDPKQLGNAVMFRANEALSIPMDQAVLDYHVVGEKRADDGSVATRVLVAAAYRDPIDQFVTACHVAHVDLVGIDVEAFALLRAVAPSAAAQTEDATRAAVVAVNVGHDRSILAISDGSICDFTRVLDWGGARIDAALSRDLGLTSDEAAELKLALTLDDENPDDDLPPAADSRVVPARESVKKELGTLARELIASLQFYQSQPESLPIAEILVTGGTTRLPGFAEELERLVRARVRAADPAGSVAPERPALTEREDLSSLTVAIGLGVER